MTKHVWPTLLVLLAVLVLTGASAGAAVLCAQPLRPNIVLIFPDNLGWGEVGAYGSVRGPLTPRIDRWPPRASVSTTSMSSSRAPSRARR